MMTSEGQIRWVFGYNFENYFSRLYINLMLTILQVSTRIAPPRTKSSGYPLRSTLYECLKNGQKTFPTDAFMFVCVEV